MHYEHATASQARSSERTCLKSTRLGADVCIEIDDDVVPIFRGRSKDIKYTFQTPERYFKRGITEYLQGLKPSTRRESSDHIAIILEQRIHVWNSRPSWGRKPSWNRRYNPRMAKSWAQWKDTIHSSGKVAVHLRH